MGAGDQQQNSELNLVKHRIMSSIQAEDSFHFDVYRSFTIQQPPSASPYGVNNFGGKFPSTPYTMTFPTELKIQEAASSPTEESLEVLKEYECLFDHVRKIKRSAHRY